VSGVADCIFCRIVSGAAPASFVYRDDRVAAFMDIQPVNDGHLLVVPVRHAALLGELSEDEVMAVMRVGYRAVGALRRSSLRCEGVNFFLADGEAAMQEVLHAHLHVFPRYQGDGFGLRFDQEYYTRFPPREALDRHAAELRALLDHD
jgi:histidine triad (HIT) family protein